MPDNKTEDEAAGGGAAGGGARGGGAAGGRGGGDLRITADMFQQMLITAVQAGRTQQQQFQQHQQLPPPEQPQPRPPGVDRKLIPQFWEARPAAWFRIFETHVPHEGTKRFDYLLSFLSLTALNQVDSIIDAPPQDPYGEAKKALLSHFERNKYDKAGDLLLITSLGDRTPSDLLRYMRSLQPGEGEGSLFVVIFLNALPKNAKDAALPKAPNLDEMAKAADIVLAVPDARPSSLSVQEVSADDGLVVDGYVDAVRNPPRHGASSTARPSSSSSASRSSSGNDSRLCAVHKRFRELAFRCASPKTCPMRQVLCPRPEAGNAKAGRQ